MTGPAGQTPAGQAGQSTPPQVEWTNRKTHWYEAIGSALNFPFLKEVSENCFVFDAVNFDN